MSGVLNAEELAKAYRLLVLWFGVQLLVSVGQFVLPAVPADDPMGLVVIAAILACLLTTLVALMYYGARTATALGSGVGWLWGLAMFMPCVNVLTLLVLSARATAACRAEGIQVGFFGPKMAADGGFERMPKRDGLEVYEPDWKKIGPES